MNRPLPLLWTLALLHGCASTPPPPSPDADASSSDDAAPDRFSPDHTPSVDAPAPDASIVDTAADDRVAPADVTVPRDVPAPLDAHDAPDIPDAPDTPDAPNTPDALDAPPTPDASAPPDALDAPDAPRDTSTPLDAPVRNDVAIDRPPDAPAPDAPDALAPCRDGTVRCDLACVDLGTSLTHCGACGRRCALPHATARCAAGACAVASCAAGWGDCDGAAANGCEVDLRASGAHCGACGNRCLGATACVDGACRCATPRGTAGYVTRTVQAAGVERRYRVYAPPSYRPRAATPTLFVYHGFDMTPDEMVADTQLNREADADAALIVYPEGRFNSWNASLCCPLATTAAVDDVAFFDAMVRDVSAAWCVDPRRLGVAGYSNGAMMAQRLACLRADVVSSVSAVSGTYDAPCAPSRPVPILYVHAVDDRIVPYDGGAFSGVAGVALPSVATTLARWRAIDRCTSAAPTTWLTAGDTTCVRFGGCAAEVSHCRVGTGGHRWPRPPQSFVASPRVMDFLRRTPR